jgi:hypothetical protein
MNQEELLVFKEFLVFMAIAQLLYESELEDFKEIEQDTIPLFKSSYHHVLKYNGTNNTLLNAKKTMIEFLPQTTGYIPGFKEEIYAQYSPTV